MKSHADTEEYRGCLFLFLLIVFTLVCSSLTVRHADAIDGISSLASKDVIPVITTSKVWVPIYRIDDRQVNLSYNIQALINRVEEMNARLSIIESKITSREVGKR